MAATTAQPRLPDHARYFGWINTHFVTHEISERTHAGTWATNPTWALERHHNATGWRGRLPAYRRKDLRRHRTGQARHALVPRRVESADANSISVTCRIDIDTHRGQTDAAVLLAILRQEIGPQLYAEASDRGISCYATWTFALERYEIDGEERCSPTKRDINARLDELHDALVKIAASAGIKATVELLGRLPTFRRDRNTDLVQISDGQRGQHIRLPRCPRAGDFDRLTESVFPASIMRQIITKAGSAKRSKATPEARAARRLERMADAGDKDSNRVKAIATAIRALGPDIDDAAIIEQANSIYEAAGFAGGQRDRERDTSFEYILRWFHREGMETALTGNDPLWFDADDIERAHQLVTSAIPRARLDDLNRQHARALDGQRITYNLIALSLCTFAKDVVTNEGQVPGTAISGMLRSYGIRANGTMVRIITELLAGAGLIQCTDTSYRTNRCRRWNITNATLSLPFIADDEHVATAKLEWEARRNAMREAGRKARAARSAQRRRQWDNARKDMLISMWTTTTQFSAALTLAAPIQRRVRPDDLRFFATTRALAA